MKKRILVIGQLDGFANSVRPRQIQRFLTDGGHETEILEGADHLASPLRLPESLLEGTS
ncbi:hypothetical protein ACFYO2_38265 [Streptomyces sp. NPDC006602]|uniref:hypothetical protein n=1 Tax=Streptomyces sp. NPDC006602 TaxID=3364751 RepID=UPI0036AEE231